VHAPLLLADLFPPRSPFPHAEGGFLVERVPRLFQRQADVAPMMRFVRDEVSKPAHRNVNERQDQPVFIAIPIEVQKGQGK